MVEPSLIADQLTSIENKISIPSQHAFHIMEHFEFYHVRMP